MYSFHVAQATMAVAQVAHRCNHQHRHPFACTMTTDLLNGPHEPAVCQDDGKHFDQFLSVCICLKII